MKPGARFMLALFCLMGLSLMYLFQRDWQIFFCGEQDVIQKLGYRAELWLPLIISKVIRYLFNDLLCLGLVIAIFDKRNHLIIGFQTMIFGLLILLPLYFLLLHYLPKEYSSLLSHLHRVVMNPILMFLLIPALWIQQKRTIVNSLK